MALKHELSLVSIKYQLMCLAHRIGIFYQLTILLMFSMLCLLATIGNDRCHILGTLEWPLSLGQLNLVSNSKLLWPILQFENYSNVIVRELFCHRSGCQSSKLVIEVIVIVQNWTSEVDIKAIVEAQNWSLKLVVEVFIGVQI